MNAIKSTVLIAGLMGLASIASAQVPTTTAGGAATTKVQGQINGPDKSPMTSDTTRAEVKSEATMANKMSKNKTVAAGEASTTGPTGQPNGRPAAENPAVSGMGTTTKDAGVPGARAAVHTKQGIATGEKTARP
ncbi:hypothetical protein GT347_13105 [Xylophilus rhododendri]|uniref:Uncharacterized protein n=1 Tax=Xylophilus rhododendri TaxID=2697032 RepID=A0A857J4G0_9BURK|nr:hypothetical protein [Xylophilus rhododendri]QHI98844.1 hypothetical protein GT347_13105 [Xylophilus rhododendri]